MIFFFERVGGTGWFAALQQETLLLPPAATPAWAACSYVLRVAQQNADLVRGWLSSLTAAALTGQQASSLLMVARTLPGAVDQLIYEFAANHVDDPNVRMEGDAWIRTLTPEQRATVPARSLLRKLLIVTLDEAGPMDLYSAEELLTLAVENSAGEDAQWWLTMLAHRARALAEEEPELRLRMISPLNELTLASARRPVELAIAALRDAVAGAAGAGVEIAQRVEALRLVPPPLAERLVAHHLLGCIDVDAGAAVVFAAEQIASNEWPSAEELALLRALLASPRVDGAALVAALGSPPALAEVEQMACKEDVSEDLVRIHRWLVAFPTESVPAWTQVDDRLPLTAASTDGVMMRSVAYWAGAAAPLSSDALNHLDPLDAARAIAQWRPETPQSFAGPTAEGLASSLAQALDARPERWASEDPVAIAAALREPLYIAAYLRALAGHLGHYAEKLERLIAAAEYTRADPTTPADLGLDPLGSLNTWEHASAATTELLKAMAGEVDLGEELFVRAWALLLDAYSDRQETINDEGDDGPLGVAINRPSMRALDAAILLGGASLPPDQRLPALLDDALRLGGADGLHARATIAPSLSWLRINLADWFAERRELILGVEAPDQLGQATLDTFLRWGAPSRELAIEHRDAYIAALSRSDYERVTEHTVLAVLNELPGYEPPAIAAALATAGKATVSHAGAYIGHELADTTVLMTPVVALWRELLALELPAAAYRGFGWTARNTAIDDQAWIELVERTVVACDGAVDVAKHVATRAAEHPDDPRAAATITALLRGSVPVWELDAVATAGLNLLARIDGAAGNDLHEALLERGFYEAMGNTE